MATLDRASSELGADPPQPPPPPQPTPTRNSHLSQDGVLRHNSFEVVVEAGEAGGLGVAASGPPYQRRMVLRAESSDQLQQQQQPQFVLPQLPALSTTRDGKVVIVSNKDARREVWAYARRAWDRCRDPQLPWRERVRELQRAVYCTMEFPRANPASKCIAFLLITSILVNACNLIAASFDIGLAQPASCADPICTPDAPGAKCTQVVCAPEEKWAILYVNSAMVAVFTLDWLARLLSVPAVPAAVIHSQDLAIDLDGKIMTPRLQSGGWRLTLEYAIGFWGFVDAASILPFYVNIFAFKPFLSLRSSSDNVLELMHFSRALRTLKLLRYSKQTVLFTRTLRASYPALRFFVLMASIILLMVAGIIFFLERGNFKVTEEHPMGAYYRPIPGGEGEQVSPFKNILVAFYWTIVSTTTLKQADLTVSSVGARVISVGLAYLSIVLLALPLSIIGRHFQRQYDLLNMESRVPDGQSAQGGGQFFFPQQREKEPTMTRGDDASDKA